MSHRIVFLTPPAHGHVNPILPVVRELVRRGEEVICYNDEGFRPGLERAGATFRPYPPSDLTANEISRLLRDGNLVNITALILRATAQLLPPLLDQLGRDRPDLVVFDSIALWGKMAATHLRLRGAASITHLVMDERHLNARDMIRVLAMALPRMPALWSARRRLVREYRGSYPPSGALFPLRGQLTLAFTLKEFQPDTAIVDESFRFVGPSIDPETRIESVPLEASAQEPLVYVSLGTVHLAETDFFRTCFEAFADHPARFVLSVGTEANAATVGPVPDNFLVRPSVPQLEILQRAAAFITHGGINSVQEGLYYGVPLVIIPHQLEQLFNARCVAGRHAAVIVDARIRKNRVSVRELREALRTVLSEPRHRAAAGELGRAMRGTGGYRQAADEIQRYLSAEPG